MLSMEKHTELLASILENPEIANVSEMVTQLKENYAGAMANTIIINEEIELLKKQNQDLTEQNMKLFLKIGQSDPVIEEVITEPEELTLTYEELINDDGYIFK